MMAPCTVMPSSSLAAVYPLVKSVLARNPRSVLDLGMGTGKYGFLLREQIDYANAQHTLRLVGVEGFPDYLAAHQRLIYDEVVTADIRDYLTDYRGSKFDAALLLDVIEHFDPLDAVEVARGALHVADALFLATPSVFWQQDGLAELERHRSWWPIAKIKRLAELVDAQVAAVKVEHKIIAVLSRGDKPRIVYDPPVKALARKIRDRAIPNRGAGPTI